MICPACKHDENSVINTSKFPSVNQRKLRCQRCGFSWSTIEMHVDHETILTHAFLLTKNAPCESLAKGIDSAREASNQA